MARWNERYHVLFLGGAYGFSWTMWIGAWMLAQASGVTELLLNEDLVWSLLFEEGLASATVGISLLSTLGVFGPMLAGFVATARDPATDSADLLRRIVRVRVGSKWYALAGAILAGSALLPAIALGAVTGPAGETAGAGSAGVFFLALLAFMLVTSGTEEVGWRGYLLEKLRPGRGLWDAGWAVGIPWALWHLPIVVLIFVQQGMPVAAMLGSLAGFGIGIVAMSILHAWFYSHTRSVFFAIVVHAAFNAVPLTVGLFTGEAYVQALVSQLLLWAVVLVIVRREERAVGAVTP